MRRQALGLSEFFSLVIFLLKISIFDFAPFISVVPPVFHPEYGRFMLESTPGAPYTGSVRDLVLVESNMRLR